MANQILYKVEMLDERDFRNGGKKELDFLNSKGSQGLELVSVIYKATLGTTYYYFKYCNPLNPSNK